MEEKHSIDDMSSVHVAPQSGCRKLGETYRAIIDASLQKPDSLDIKALETWYKEYVAADGDSLVPESDTIFATQDDALDEATVETCILKLYEQVTVECGFCRDCQNLFDNWPDLSDPKAESSSKRGIYPGTGVEWGHILVRDCHTLVLEAATRKGCKMCAFLLHILKDCEWTYTKSNTIVSALHVFRRVEARLQYLGACETPTIALQNWVTGPSQLLWLNFPGKSCSNYNSGIASYTGRQSEALPSSASVYSQKVNVIETVRYWSSSCLVKHDQCKTNQQGSLPTRLISIAGNKLRLVHTEGWEERPRYSTLSHRWVSEPFLRLTDDNQESLLEEIPTTELPQTFKDAVYISRELGLHFLWIDSLCIVQGNGEDWDHEATLMSSVYGNSFINIAASSARNMKEGCFLKPPHFVCGLRALVTVKGKSFVRDFRGFSDYEKSVTRSYLATRAWTLQEKLLPARTIHFGDRGAFWECRAHTANEFLPEGFPTILAMPTLMGNSRNHFKSWWLNVVELYSAADLTFDKDKLPAISGVARQIHEEQGIQYLAGMWRDQLELYLCWEVAKPRKRPVYRAPSWSWASINGKVRTITPLRFDNYSGIFSDVYTHVVEAETKHSVENPFGTVTEGRLRVTCSGLLSAQLIRQDAVKLQLNKTNCEDPGELRFTPDCLEQEWAEMDDIVYLLPIFGGYTGSGYGRRKSDQEKEEEARDKGNDEAHGEQDPSQKVVEDEGSDEDDDSYVDVDTLAICGIVLCKTPDKVGQFRRIGMFKFWQDDIEEEKEDLYKPFLNALELHGAEAARATCTEVTENTAYPTEKYVICII